MLRGYLVVFSFWEYFGHFFRLRGYFWSFLGLRVLWFFFSFQGISVTFWLMMYIGHFLMPRGYLIHFQPLGVFWSSYQAKGVFLVSFRFQWFFGLFLGFNGILVFFQASKVYQFFFMFREYFSHFLGGRGVSVIFLSLLGKLAFFQSQGYFSHFQGLLNYILLILVFFLVAEGILVIFWVVGVFQSFSKFMGISCPFFSLRGISVI